MGNPAPPGSPSLRAAGHRQGHPGPGSGHGRAGDLLSPEVDQPDHEVRRQHRRVAPGILRIAANEGKGVLFLDEADALALEHLLPPPKRARPARAWWRPCAKSSTDSPRNPACSWWPPPRARTPSIRPWWPRVGSITSSRSHSPTPPPSRNIRQDPGPDRARGRPFRLLHHRLPDGASRHGGHERRGDVQIVQRALEVKVQRAAEHQRPAVTTEDPHGHRRVQARARRGREDPLRPVPMMPSDRWESLGSAPLRWARVTRGCWGEPPQSGRA